MNFITSIGLCFYCGGGSVYKHVQMCGAGNTGCGLMCRSSMVKGSQFEVSGAGVVLTFKSTFELLSFPTDLAIQQPLL